MNIKELKEFLEKYESTLRKVKKETFKRVKVDFLRFISKELRMKHFKTGCYYKNKNNDGTYNVIYIVGDLDGDLICKAGKSQMLMKIKKDFHPELWTECDEIAYLRYIDNSPPLGGPKVTNATEGA